MPEFNCEETKSYVHEFLHNELAESEITEVTAHLANCDTCEGAYDLESLLNKAISRSCSDTPPEDLAQKVLQRVRELQNREQN